MDAISFSNNKLRGHISQTNDVTNLSWNIEPDRALHGTLAAIRADAARKTQGQDGFLGMSQVPIAIDIHIRPHQVRDWKLSEALFQTLSAPLAVEAGNGGRFL